uniref:Uncharacterized protein n=1 Tax=Oncorhynchus mykiss TaxID=8022 RepID=A0A8C7NQB4_ONCMY
MCTTILIISTLSVILRRRFNNRVKPLGKEAIKWCEKHQGSRFELILGDFVLRSWRR